MSELVFPQDQDISDLISNSVNVTILLDMNDISSIMQNDNMFTIADSDLSVNYNIKRSDINSDITEYLLTNYLEITGNWWYGSSGIGSLKIRTEIIPDLTSDSQSVINRKYFEDNYLGMIYELSNQIFGEKYGRNKPTLFSHVGEIVTFLKKVDRTALKKIFGSNTNWEPLSEDETMIIGVGKPASNTMTKYGDLNGGKNTFNLNAGGGNKTVSLNADNLVSHTHRMTVAAGSINKKWHVWFNHDGGSEKYPQRPYDVAVTPVFNKDHGSEKDPDYDIVTSGAIGGPMTIRGSKTVSFKSLWNNLTYVIKSIFNPQTKKKMNTTSTPHNNIPPVVLASVWRRTS